MCGVETGQSEAGKDGKEILQPFSHVQREPSMNQVYRVPTKDRAKQWYRIYGS